MDVEGDYDYDEAVDALKHVFGIVGICPVEVADVDAPDKLKEMAVSFFGREYPDTEKSFKVHVRRLDKRYTLDSQQLNAMIGEAILEAYPSTHVDVHDPDIMLQVEIREKVYFYSHVIPGPGGLKLLLGQL